MSLTPVLHTTLLPAKISPPPGNLAGGDVLDQTAKKYTAVFFTQFTQEMMEGLEAVGGFGEELFRTFLADALGDSLADSPAGESITQRIADQMKILQEDRKVAPPPGNPYFKEKSHDV